MKNFVQLTLASSVLLTTVFLAGCDDEDELKLTGEKKEFALSARSNPSISGMAIFEELEDNSTRITIQLNGTQSGTSHPAHIHENTAAQGGDIVIDLASINGSTGTSVTEVKAMKDGTAITYDELLDFDGYINVHGSETDLATLVAQGDIGQNELTGNTEVYTLAEVSASGVSGTATFAERANGETLVTLDLDGTTAGVNSPAHIHMNSAAETGGIAIDLTAVNGTTGLSLTNVTQLNAGTPILYSDLVNFDGYINVHASSTNLGTLLAQGDIGGNELTGDSEVYPLASVSDPNISGTVTFAERKNGATLVTISLQGTQAGGDHPAHVHMNNAATTGPITISLSNVSGATGKSVTNVDQLNSGTAINYDGLINYNGYVNVHLSSSNLGTLIAQGNIGSNG